MALALLETTGVKELDAPPIYDDAESVDGMTPYDCAERGKEYAIWFIPAPCDNERGIALVVRMPVGEEI